MSPDAAAALSAGQHALAEGEWARAREAFTSALVAEETAWGLLGMADACWWLGDLRGALDHRERAFAALRRDQQPAWAAAVALRLCFDHRKHVGNLAASSGWLARARRIIDEHDLDGLRGFLALMRSYTADDLEAAEDHARDALARAQGSGDLDLELRALSQLGATLIAQGRIDEGTVHLDEAMAGALAQEGSDLDTVVFASCNMIVSCTACAEFERAVQWIRATERFTERFGCPFLFAECRTFYGAVLVATGEWGRAEEELASALELTHEAVPTLQREALAAFATLRLFQGRVEDAERLVAGVEQHPETAVVAARLQLERGEADRAAATARRQLAATSNRLRRAELLEVLTDAELAAGGVADRERGADLVALGDDAGCTVVGARGHRISGHVCLVDGDPTDAVAHFEAALAGFTSAGMPYEVARTRVALARTLAEQERDRAVAIGEARDALVTFEDLGAKRDVDAAAALLRSLGVTSARSRPRSDGPLTERESEVLDLLAEGLSNPDIAQRLFISRKTVEHHVSHVLAKLGVRNRAEAASLAARRENGGAV